MKKIIVLTLFLAIIISVNVSAQVAVIANKSVTETEISKSKLIEIYSLSANKWKSGEKIVVFDLKSEGKTRNEFYSFLGKSPDDLKKIWMRAQLTGEGTAPKSFGSEYEILEKVASTPNSIGFVAADKVNASVKVLLTIK
jgi:ABC-type phosphate transport system substrate-binding protein